MFMKKNKLFFKVAFILLNLTVLIGNGAQNPIKTCKNSNLESFNDDVSVNYTSYKSNANIEDNKDLDVFLLSYNVSNVTQSLQFRVETSETAGEDANYYIGFYEDKTKIYPAYLEYDVIDKAGNVEVKKTEIVQKANHGIGSSLGAQTFSSFCDIEVPYDCKVDIDSVRLTNVYKAIFKYDENHYVTSRDPDLEHPYSFKLTKYRTYYERYLNQIIDTSFVKFAEYDNYLTITVKIDNFGEKIYPQLSSTTKSLYSKNKKKIESGDIVVRTSLNIGGDTLLVVTKKDGSVEKINSYVDNLKYYDDVNYSTFLISNLKKEDVINFQLYAASVSVELFSKNTHKVIARSSVSSRFGLIDFKMKDILNKDNTVAIKAVDINQNVDYNVVFVSTIVAFFIVYIGCAIGYYFFIKNKDKKSEFKVLNNKQFIKVNILGILCLFSLVVDVLYITARTTLFNNSLTVYNPLDWVIILASIVFICLGGYFVKYFYTNYKDYREKIARERLNLNKDEADDGTK